MDLLNVEDKFVKELQLTTDIYNVYLLLTALNKPF